MTKLILVFALFLGHVNLPKNETKIDREVKILEAKLAKVLNTKVISPCQQTCLDRLRVATNVCNHVAPANKIACMNNALTRYYACKAACN